MLNVVTNNFIGLQRSDRLHNIRVLLNEFILKSTLITTDFRTRRYEYSHPPLPQLTL